jgi:hypothetical protein
MVHEESPDRFVLPTNQIQESDLIELWKYFEDWADSLRERQ